jgi:hypothetical protein
MRQQTLLDCSPWFEAVYGQPPHHQKEVQIYFYSENELPSAINSVVKKLTLVCQESCVGSLPRISKNVNFGIEVFQID